MTKIAEASTSRTRLRWAAIALAALAAFVLGAVPIPSARAQSLSVLHSFAGTYTFAGAPDGAKPLAGLIMDKAGSLYGTTSYGGSFDAGTVFKLDTSGNETVLHSFPGSFGDGVYPRAGLITDKAGNLYGTTNQGGGGNGTVFKLDTSGNETVLHSFTGSDGYGPYADLIMDKEGNLYGTTSYGGSSGDGTVFKLDTSGNETVLHSFTYSDGYSPSAGLIMDKAGNLYGTAGYGGTSSNCLGGCGTVFKLDTSGNETVLHSFTGGDGSLPSAGLVMDRAGTLYGTTLGGGAYGQGTVFKLDTSGNETVLHSFTGADGANPDGTLMMDKAGNLYGTTYVGGAYGQGTVFKLIL